MTTKTPAVKPGAALKAESEPSGLCLPLYPDSKADGAVAVLTLFAAEQLVRMERRKAINHPSARFDPTPKAYRNHAKGQGADLVLMDKAAQEIREGRRPVNCLPPPEKWLYMQPDGSLGPKAVA